jgi:hypothetical protein
MDMGALSDAMDLVVQLRNAIASANERDCLGGYFDYLIGDGINRQLEALDIEPIALGDDDYTFKIVRTTEGDDTVSIDNVEIYNLQGQYVFTLADDQYNPEGNLQFDTDDMITYWLYEHGQHVLAEYELDDAERSADLMRGY